MSVSPYVSNSRAASRAVRAGTVDARPADAAGRGAVRRAPAAGSRRSRRDRRGSCRRRSRSRDQGVDSYKDITPRMGAAYDVFGNGKTAIKVNIGKYLEGVGIAAQLRQHESDAAAAQHHVGLRTARRHADVDRCERQFHARLRSAESERAGSPRQRRRLLRADLEPALRPEHLDQHLRSGAPRRAGASVPRTGTSARPSSSRFSRVPRWKSPTAGGGITASRSTDNLLVQTLGLHAVQRHRAARSPSARWRRLHGLRPL